ncbi:hypothetical protein Mal15_09800 [Stieleria maiorica]|uniref:Uncharacterized protein n=1 Tax=Stieleria maiorica TaxID=2795974 RepID=A0A5B9MA61_9BACT|nr:hypothetical protein [Stieleria maiorica]QEF96950.1 hypothetical protein Mal15_09800 [Stieleria maiorica]
MYNNEADAPRLLIEATLFVADRNAQLNDSAVIGALRSIKNQTTSRSSFTQGVTEEMIARLDAAGVSPSDRRTAASELLAIAVQNVDPDSPQALIRYLELIAS